jgi:hypothetical protein
MRSSIFKCVRICTCGMQSVVRKSCGSRYTGLCGLYMSLCSQYADPCGQYAGLCGL